MSAAHVPWRVRNLLGVPAPRRTRYTAGVNGGEKDRFVGSDDLAFPGATWDTIDAEEAGFRPAALAEARFQFEAKAGDGAYRVVIVRNGRIVSEWHRGVAPEQRLPIASAAKSFYSNMLGIAVAEGKIPSADAKVVDYYPQMMDVRPNEGPKENRHAFPENRAITFRQLISNTSGYMKPGERPGEAFNYQTFGMNVLTHAIAAVYGRWYADDPESSPGFGTLIEEKVARPIGAFFDYTHTNFALPQAARIDVFGYYCQMHTTARDAARAGLLWCAGGRWRDRQVIPREWMHESVRVAPDIVANCPRDLWYYGHGFWTNAKGVLWPDLPLDGFSACGAGGHYVSVFPSLSLVIVQNPGPYAGMATRANPEFLALIINSIR